MKHTNAPTETNTLPPLGGPVVVRAAAVPTAGAVRLPTHPRSPNCYATLARLTAGLPAAGAVVARLADTGTADDEREGLDDAARRVGPANTRDTEAFERAVELASAALDRAGGPVLVLPGADRIDPPSQRVIAHAWLRRPARPGATLVLELGADDGPRLGELGTAVRAATFEAVALALRATWEAAPRPADGSGPVPTPAEAVRSFLRRNYPHAGSVPDETAEGCLVRALVAARTGHLPAARDSLTRMAAVAPDWRERARASSARAVLLSKYGTPGDLAEAEAAIARGLAACGDGADPDVCGQRGWLCNNAALIHVMKYLATRDRTELRRAARWLNRALADAGRVPPGRYQALVYNARANAVQLLEMMGDPGGALVQLDARFAGTEHPSYHYRRAHLLVKAGRHPEALDALGHADAACRPREWPFAEYIARARGHLLHKLGRPGAAADEFRRGLERCRAVRSAEGTRHHAAGLICCLKAGGNVTAARDLGEQLLAEEGVTVANAAEPPKPAGKLPPFVPELDLMWPARSNVNTQLNRVSEVQK